MGGVSANVTILRPAAGSTVSEATSMLERTRYRSGTTTVIRNTALRAGSSKHGNARRATAGSHWVNPYPSAPAVASYRPLIWRFRQPANTNDNAARPYGPSRSGVGVNDSKS